MFACFFIELCNFRAVLLHICQRRNEADGSKGCCTNTTCPSQHEQFMVLFAPLAGLETPCSCPSYLGPCQVCHVTRWPDVASCVTGQEASVLSACSPTRHPFCFGLWGEAKKCEDISGSTRPGDATPAFPACRTLLGERRKATGTARGHLSD